MDISSVLADAGFATGAGGAGAFAVVGCGVSDFCASTFLFPHIWQISPVSGTPKNPGAKPGCKTMYLSDQNVNKGITGAVFLKVTLRAGSPAEGNTVQRKKVGRQLEITKNILAKINASIWNRAFYGA